MPPERRLADDEVADPEAVDSRRGRLDPRSKLSRRLGAIVADYDELRKEHWAWQPLRDPEVAGVIDRRLAAGRDRSLSPGPDGRRRA